MIIFLQPSPLLRLFLRSAHQHNTSLWLMHVCVCAKPLGGSLSLAFHAATPLGFPTKVPYPLTWRNFYATNAKGLVLFYGHGKCLSTRKWQFTLFMGYCVLSMIHIIIRPWHELFYNTAITNVPAPKHPL